jgi:ankyrin repeat protein
LTPLMLAVKAGSEEIVRMLLNLKVPPDIEAKTQKRGNFETAPLIASKNGFKSIVQLLLDHGAECIAPYPRGRTPEDIATELPIIEMLQKARRKKKRWYQKLLSDEMDNRVKVLKRESRPPQRSPLSYTNMV